MSTRIATWSRWGLAMLTTSCAAETNPQLAACLDEAKSQVEIDFCNAAWQRPSETVQPASDEYFLAIGIGWLVSALLAGVARQARGGAFSFGFLLGAILGPLGLIAALVIKPDPAKPNQRFLYRECPHCKEQIRRDASVCSHCQRESEAWVFRDGKWWVQRSDGDLWFDDRQRQWVRETPN